MTLSSALSAVLCIGCLTMAASERRNDAAASTVLGWAGFGTGYGLLAVATVSPTYDVAFSVLFLGIVIASASLLCRGFG